ncbi:succinate:fumarate antiporter [Salix suchowensis]|nr:succinate:fumarate antiporter [Salix suchowensis]
MSFLRRIPELAFLARRVVEAEAKRRAKEERRSHVPERQFLEVNPGPKMKRLFTFTIRKLYDEGSIVLWDGPVHPYASKYGFIPPNDGLWKISSKSAASTQMHNDSLSLSATFSMTCDSASISCSTTPDVTFAFAKLKVHFPILGRRRGLHFRHSAYLAPLVEEAIEVLVGRMKSANTANGNTRREPTMHTHPGPTLSQITSYLQRKDSRWAKIGEWKVHEALTLLRDTGKIWATSGHDRETRVCIYPLALAAVFRETGNISLARVHGWIRWPLPIQYIPVEPYSMYIAITGRASVRASYLEAVTEAVVSCFEIELMLYILGSWGNRRYPRLGKRLNDE